MVFPIVMYGCENKLTKTKQMKKHKIETEGRMWGMNKPGEGVLGVRVSSYKIYE